MNPRALIAFLTLGCGTLMTTTIGFAIAWMRSRERAIRAELRGDRVSPGTAAADHDTRMQQAVDAIALEVERIAEGQRFTTRLLSESRGDNRARAADRGRDVGRIVTPH